MDVYKCSASITWSAWGTSEAKWNEGYSLSVTQVWISAGDVVLVSLREFQNDKCDVILKYTSEEVRMLKAEDEIPENIEANENNDDNIEFAEKQGGDDDSDSDEDSEESDSDEEIEVPKKLAEKDIDDIWLPFHSSIIYEFKAFNAQNDFFITNAPTYNKSGLIKIENSIQQTCDMLKSIILQIKVWP